MTISKTGGLIAAASKKASRPTLQLGGITVVERIVFTFQQMGLFPIVVVTGVEADEVKHQLAGRGVVFLHNEAFEDPELLSSVKMGLSFLQDKCEQVVFAPVNGPVFLPSTLRALVHSGHKIANPCYKGKVGHPVLFSNALIPDILAWTGDGGLREALNTMGHLRALVEVEDEGAVLTVHQKHRFKKSALQKHYEDNKAAFFHPRLRLSLEREEELFNARAKLLLLLIGETQSVRAASQMMALSASKAWDMLNKLEAALGYALITRRQGGVQGSHSELTPEGLNFLKVWQAFEEKMLANADLDFEALRPLLQGPLP